jgi:hypothetical protein
MSMKSGSFWRARLRPDRDSAVRRAVIAPVRLAQPVRSVLVADMLVLQPTIMALKQIKVGRWRVLAG